MIRKELGKIKCVSYGLVDGRIGITFELGGIGWGVNDAWNFWAYEPTKYTHWDLKVQNERYADITRKIIKLLADANKNSIDELRGVPVEVTIHDGMLKEWRILTEVL